VTVAASTLMFRCDGGCRRGRGVFGIVATRRQGDHTDVAKAARAGASDGSPGSERLCGARAPFRLMYPTESVKDTLVMLTQCTSQNFGDVKPAQHRVATWVAHGPACRPRRPWAHPRHDRSHAPPRLATGSIGLYIGFDPTADSLHRSPGRATVHAPLPTCRSRPFRRGAAGMVGDPGER
jgi:hypothetical protein